MTELIDGKRIVNVSLEGSCMHAVGGECEGFEFGDPPFTLLTSDVLPGIPLARIKPLEHIMVEALQKVDDTKTGRKKKVKRLKMEVFEEEEPEPCPEGQKRNPDTGECEPIPPEEQVTTVDITPVVSKPSVEPDETGQCPEGMRINALGKCVETEDCGEGRHWDANANEGQGACVADTPPKPEHPETSHGLPAAPQEDVLTDAPTEVPKPGEQPPVTHPPKLPEQPEKPQPAPEAQPLKPLTPSKEPPLQPPEPETVTPTEPHTCQPGYHYDYDANMCMPDAPILERVKRFQAEDKAKSLKTKVATWEKRYVTLDTQHQQLLGTCRQQKVQVNSLLDQAEQHRKDLVEAQVARDKMLRLRDEAAGLRDDFRTRFEKLQTDHTTLTRKYGDVLDQAKAITEKNTTANKEILDLYTKIEHLEAQLNKAKSMGKKIGKIRLKL